jgi:hypothetical protein
MVHLYAWSLAAVVARSCTHVGGAALLVFPRSHPARTFYLGQRSKNNELHVHPLYAGLPIWAIQAARATLLLALGGLLYMLVFGEPAWFGIDYDPIRHAKTYGPRQP